MVFCRQRQDFKNDGDSRSKPHPYLMGLERLDGEKQEAIIVEDSERGLRSALSAGIDCVIVHNPFTIGHYSSKAIRTLHDLLSLLTDVTHFPGEAQKVAGTAQPALRASAPKLKKPSSWLF